MKSYGPTQPYSIAIHKEKYRNEGETFEDCINRVASTLSDSPSHYKSFRNILLTMRFLPAGRVQAAIGSSKNITPYNCFVSGTIEDSFVDGENSIMDIATQAAATMRMGGGIGYDFSTLRPRGSLIRKLGSQTSGAVSFMNIFDAICKNVASSGHRRGAQMAVLRVDHPDIEEYINAKHNNVELTAFNTSIAITDEFMECVENDAMFSLRWDGITVKSIRAVELWEMIMRSTYDWAEPGVLFIDRINNNNNLWYIEQIAATNPCAEQPLPPYGACLLGSINLVKYIKWDGEKYWFDYGLLKSDIPHIIRGMDNIVDKALYPLERQKEEAISKRRMGIGITGLANTIEILGYSYGSSTFIQIQETIMKMIRDESYIASINLAKEKGVFPKYDQKLYKEGSFITSLPQYIQDDIQEFGIRNSHLLSIAPTGTISFSADNVSSGIEPVFAHEYERTVIEFGGTRTEIVRDYALEFYGVKGRKTSEVTVNEHLSVLATAQKYVDSSVSKTCNVDENISWQDFKEVYWDAYMLGCKGCTTYRPNSGRSAVLTEKPEKEVIACEYDPVTGMKTCE